MSSVSNTTVLFEAPEAPAVLYPGKVMHARLKPFGHRFKYRVFTCLFDLDKLRESGALSRFFSINRNNLVSFHEKDHLPQGEESSLRDYVTDLVVRAGCPAPHKIMLLAYPRIFGFVFNPIANYFCYDQNGALTAVIYEVRNTFKERHTYVCKVESGQLTRSGLRQERNKIFYVSPFMDMDMRYHFRVTPPCEEVKIRIFETEGPDPILSATFHGISTPFNTKNLLGQVVGLPFMTLKVVAGIHWEALKLWIKGAKFRSRGKPPAPVSYRDTATGPAE